MWNTSYPTASVQLIQNPRLKQKENMEEIKHTVCERHNRSKTEFERETETGEKSHLGSPKGMT